MWKLARNVLAVGILAGALPAAAAEFVYMTGVTDPWGNTGAGSNDQAMDTAFGPGNWTKFNGFVLGAIAGDTRFLFLDGGDSSANALNAFIAANPAALETYVSAGGAIFINAAPNEGGSFSMGFGVTLTYPSSGGDGNAAATAEGLATGLFDGIASVYTGDSFAHAFVSGAGLIAGMVNGNGDTVFGGMDFGSGFAAFGGMTNPQFHDPDPDADILRARMLGAIADQFETVAIPEPFSLAMLGIGLLGFAALRRR